MYSLADYAYCCEFAEGAVILDLRADTYLAVNAEQLPSLRRSINNWPAGYTTSSLLWPNNDVNAEALIASLLNRGVLATATTPHRIEFVKPALATSAISVTADFAEIVRFVDLGRFLTSLMTVIHLRRRGLVSLVNWLRQAQRSLPSDCHAVSESTTTLLKSFLRLRLLFYTAYRTCLFDSLVLSVFLSKARVPCTFVIGVSIKPFLAHAWVQIGDTVLNDTAENVQLYTPIFCVTERD